MFLGTLFDSRLQFDKNTVCCESVSIYCESWMFLRAFYVIFIILSWKVCWHFPLFVGFMVYLWRRRTVSAVLPITVQDHWRPANWLELYLEEMGWPESQTIHESSWPHPQSGVLFDTLRAALSCPPRRTNRFSNSCIPSAFIEASECWQLNDGHRPDIVTESHIVYLLHIYLLYYIIMCC